MSASAGDLVNHPQTVRFELVNPRLDIVNRKRQVVQPFSAFIQKDLHGALGIGRFEQFEPHVVDPEKTDAYPLVCHVLAPFEHGPQDAFVKGSVILNGSHGNANMVE